MSDAYRALLVAGGQSVGACRVRYGNDLAWWATCLVAREVSCQVFYGRNGVSKAGGASRDFTKELQTRIPTIPVQEATKQNIVQSLSWVSEAPSLGLIIASNHGSETGLCLWSKEEITPKELGATIKTPKNLCVLIMGQCFSGIFGPLANEKTVAISACSAKQESYSCPVDSPKDEPLYDEFLYQLGCALFGEPQLPNAQSLLPYPPLSNYVNCPVPNQISLHDAFLWAQQKDRANGETPQIIDPGGLAARIAFYPSQVLV